jgi:hypothetical protein
MQFPSASKPHVNRRPSQAFRATELLLNTDMECILVRSRRESTWDSSAMSPHGSPALAENSNGASNMPVCA